jgi:hypothetical protein
MIDATRSDIAQLRADIKEYDDDTNELSEYDRMEVIQLSRDLRAAQ